MTNKNSHPKYTLLFDGQCVICRHLMDAYVNPHTPEELKVKPFQEAQFDKDYPEDKLSKCREEIIFVDEEKQEFIGGYKAVAKVLGLTKQLGWLKVILDFPIFAPFNWFGYNMIAWHRYNWIIVPPHLRCAECEIKIPIIWNIIFFVLIGAAIVGFSGLNVYFWFETLKNAAGQLFGTISKELDEITLWTLLLSSSIFGVFQGICFLAYKKVLGVNKIDVIKHSFIVNAFISAITVLVIYIALYFSPQIAESTKSNPNSIALALTTGILCIGIFFGQFFIIQRWNEINFSKASSIPIILLDSLLRALSPFAVLYFI